MVELIHGTSDNTPRRPEVIPEGTYAAEIVKAEGRESPFQNARPAWNPKGLEINLRFAVQVAGARMTAFDSIAVTKILRLNELLDAAGLPHITDDCKRFEETNLEGKVIGIRIYHNANGKAKVGEYLRVEMVPGHTPTKRTAAAAKASQIGRAHV